MSLLEDSSIGKVCLITTNIRLKSLRRLCKKDGYKSNKKHSDSGDKLQMKLKKQSDSKA